MSPTPEQRAETMWRIHPKELQDRGITRVAYYAEQIHDAISAERAEIERLTTDNKRLRAAVQPAAQSVLDEFVEDLTSQQRSYIVDQIVRRTLAALEPKP